MATKSLAVLSAITALLFAIPATAQPRPSDMELAQLLRAGGTVIVLRHGATHADQADTDPLNHGNLAQQRQLNAKGEEAAKAFGEAFRRLGAPVSKAITSQFNRAYQTAKLAGFDNVEKSLDLTEGGLVVSPNENNRRAAAFRKLASTVPPAGSNVVIVSHKPNIIDRSARTGSRSRKAKPRSSSRTARLTKSSRVCKWTNGRASRPLRNNAWQLYESARHSATRRA